MGQPADRVRLPGGRPGRRRRAARLPRRTWASTRSTSRRSSSRPRTTATTPTTTRRSTRCSAATPPSARLLDAAHARGITGRARRRVQPRQPRLLPVPRHPGERRRLGLPRLVPRQRLPAERLRRRASRPATRPGGACPPCPSSTPTPRPSASSSWGSAEHWIDFGHRRLAARRGQRDRRRRASGSEFRRRVRAGNPEAYIVGEVWDDGRQLAPGRHVGRGDELPVHPRLHRLLHRRRASTSDELRDQPATRSTRRRRGLRAGTSSGCSSLYPPDVTAVQLNLLDSHDMARFLTHGAGRRVGAAAGDPVPDDLPRRPVDLLRRRDRHGRRPRPGLSPRASPGTRAPGTSDLRAYFKAAIALRHAHPALRTGDVPAALRRRWGLRFRAQPGGRLRRRRAEHGASPAQAAAAAGRESGRQRPLGGRAGRGRGHAWMAPCWRCASPRAAAPRSRHHRKARPAYQDRPRRATGAPRCV